MNPLVIRPGLRLSRSIDDYPDGLVLPIDKPYRWTSADVIRKVKWMAIKWFGKRSLKVGHAGTLDPLATGVLIVCIGKATRLAESFQAEAKQYLAGVTFGATTASYDLEKEIDSTFPTDGVNEDSLRRLLEHSLGEQDQIAPLFSAKSVDGVRVYETARKLYRAALREGRAFDPGEAGDLLRASHITLYKLELLRFRAVPEGVVPPCDPPHCVGPLPFREPTSPEDTTPSGRIHVADISGYALPQADIRIDCSKGTYIRALARDWGEALGSGAFLHSLRRTKNGPFRVEEALNMEDIQALFRP